MSHRLPSSRVCGTLGVPHLKRLWSTAMAARAGMPVRRPGEARLDRVVLDALGLGLHQTWDWLMRTAPGFDDFEAWVVATAGRPDDIRVQRLQAMVRQGRLDGWLGLARMVPSHARQVADHALIARVLHASDRMTVTDATTSAPPQQAHTLAERARLQALLVAGGLRADAANAYADAWPGTPLDFGTWLASPVAAPFRYLWMGCDGHGCGSIVLPQGDDDDAQLRRAAHGLPGVTLVDKAASVSRLFGRYRRYASVWLLAAIGLIVPVFGWRYGWRRMPRVLAPPVLGIALTLAALGYLGQPLTLFHWMALMLVLGVGANYAVFLHEGEPHAAHRPGAMYASVLLSALTALLSFGLLSLSSMPALRDFGLTLLLGIAFTALLVPTSQADGDGAL